MQDFTDPSSALALGEQIVLDRKRLEPQAWVLWQAVEPSARKGEAGSNWGLVRADMSTRAPIDMSLHITAKYWTMASFSRYIRPAYRLVRNDDPDTITALAPGGREAVVVHINHGPYARRLTISTHGLTAGPWRPSAVYQDAKPRPQACAEVPPVVIAPARSVTTMLLRRQGPGGRTDAWRESDEVG